MLSIAGEVARAFDLGAPVESTPGAGGLSNELWRVVTNRGNFAVKVMRANASSPKFRGLVNWSEYIAGSVARASMQPMA